jgi:nitrite reductase/ring-hydroxylating ferredoxin subunit
VDTTGFQHLPDEWIDAAEESDLPEGQPIRRDVNGVPLLLVRASDAIHVLADRCTHRGGPLDEGEISGGCITCPWHGSTFRLSDGEVVTGPATRPQTVLEVRTIDGRVQVRRSSEIRTLRTNPIGV